MTNWGIVLAERMHWAPLISFTSRILKSVLFTVCYTSVMKTSLRIWCAINRTPLVWWFSFFSSHSCSVECELVLLREIRKLITLKCANFKLDPELNLLNDHPLIPCRTINNFLSFFISHRDLTSLKKMKTPKWIEKKSTRMGEKKKEEKMGMSTITQQSNHQRKERKTSQNQSLRLKSLPLRRKRFVSLLITILYCCKINHYYQCLKPATLIPCTRMHWIWYDFI